MTIGRSSAGCPLVITQSMSPALVCPIVCLNDVSILAVVVIAIIVVAVVVLVAVAVTLISVVAIVAFVLIPTPCLPLIKTSNRCSSICRP